MNQPTANPLSGFFRQPALYINLTSGGEFWPEGALELTAIGDLPVFPMTAKDEITLRTPDALLNGTSVVSVLESCCPNIKDAWQMPSIDVDSTLIAIRIASYGESMQIKAKCPECKEEHEYDIDLQSVLSKIQKPDYTDTVRTESGLTIKLKPLNYMQVSKSGSVAFEESKLIQSLSNPDLDKTVRELEYKKHIDKMIELNLENITNCTESITTSTAVVTDRKFIEEFYANAAGNVLKSVQDKLAQFSEIVGIKKEVATCSECEKEFSIQIDFDYSSFFDKGF